MRIEFYGVRGSYPVANKEMMEYGGNTTCVSITKDRRNSAGKITRLIFDSGTGIIQLGKDIIKNFFDHKEDLDLHIFFSHLHPDHTQGFPFFAPNFFKNCTIYLYGMQTLQKHIGDILSEMMYPPTFPIEYRDLKSHREHVVVADGSAITIGDFKVDCMQAFAPSHPQQGAIYYKVTDMVEGKSVACIWDNESKIGGDKAVIRFAKDCDIMIHDTQYTTEEYQNDKMIVQGFGHSTYDMAIENAKQANVKSLLCMHFNPNHNDEFLKEIADSCDEMTDTPIVTLAKESMKIDLIKDSPF